MLDLKLIEDLNYLVSYLMFANSRFSVIIEMIEPLKDKIKFVDSKYVYEVTKNYNKTFNNDVMARKWREQIWRDKLYHKFVKELMMRFTLKELPSDLFNKVVSYMGLQRQCEICKYRKVHYNYLNIKQSVYAERYLNKIVITNNLDVLKYVFKKYKIKDLSVLTMTIALCNEFYDILNLLIKDKEDIIESEMKKINIIIPIYLQNMDMLVYIVEKNIYLNILNMGLKAAYTMGNPKFTKFIYQAFGVERTYLH